MAMPLYCCPDNFMPIEIHIPSAKSRNHHHHHHHHPRSFFVKWTAKLLYRIWLLFDFLSHHKLIFLHMFTSLLLLCSLFFKIKFIVFKIKLYYKELPSAVASPWLPVLLACDCIYLLCDLISAIDFLVPPIAAKPPSSLKLMLIQDLSNGNGNHDGLTGSERYPSVHVLIPCCKEPTEVPQDSILAALALDYPKDRLKVFVLDDGSDDDLKDFCNTLRIQRGGNQVIYLRRKKTPGVNHNFKCGNMNYGLQHSDAEYIVMMDADMILHPSFLDRLLPHIVNSPNVAFVQIPQSFYNLPVGDPLNDACGFGYDRGLVHRNTFGYATCVGTGAIFRRSHLDRIGGFQPQSITEDTMTAYALFNHGYTSVYVNEKLQVGLTPWTFEGFVKQRQRWVQGAIQQFEATWRSMLGRGSKLHILQKVSYFWHTGYYYLSFNNIILVLVLWSTLAFRLNLVVGNYEENETMVLYMALYMVCWWLFWHLLWLEVPQAIQSRNRDDSQFWWMTPFFFEMVVEAATNYKGTFNFVPTGNIDRSVAASKAKQLPWMRKISDLKHVRVHITFITVAMMTVVVRGYMTITNWYERRCGEGMMVVGLSVFLMSVCAHMSVPVLYILWPTGFTPEQRKSLLKYSQEKVPIFDPTKTGPKWHPSLIFFELLSCLQLAFWGCILWMIHTHGYRLMCSPLPF